MSTGTDTERLQQNNALLEEHNSVIDTIMVKTNSLPNANSEASNVKMFNSVEEMVANEKNNDGDIAVIYNLSEVALPSEAGTVTANALYLPGTLPAGTTFRLRANTTLEGYYVKISSPTDGVITDDYSSNSFDLYGQNSDGSYSRGTGPYDVSKPIFSLENIYLYNGDYSVTNVEITDPNDNGWQYIKLLNITDMVVYQYDARRASWSILPNKYHVTANDIVLGKSALSRTGPVEGSLDLTSNLKLTSLKAISMQKIKDLDMSVDPLGEILPDIDVLLNITTVPENFGDKRYFFSVAPSMMGGANDLDIRALYFDDPDTVLYLRDKKEITNTAEVADDTLVQFLSGKKFSFVDDAGMWDRCTIIPITDDAKIISTMATTSINGLTEEVYKEQTYVHYGRFICTNLEIQAQDTKEVLVKPGPKASTTPVGQRYYNIFGQPVEGTYEPNYTELGTISPTEYNTAVGTANDIKGGNI